MDRYINATPKDSPPQSGSVMGTVARGREGVRNTSGFTGISPPGAPGGGGEARRVPHLEPAPPSRCLGTCSLSHSA